MSVGKIEKEKLQVAAVHDTRNRKLSFAIVLYLATICMPFLFNLGSMRLSPYRLILLALFIPLVIRWLSGKAGKIVAPDYFVLFYCIWAGTAIFVNHGIENTWEFVGIYVVETLSPYLLARCYVRNFDQYQKLLNAFFVLLLILLPIAIIETLTGFLVINNIFGAIGDTYPWAASEKRLGFNRVQGPFEHPILFGITCASFFSLLFFSGKVQKPEKIVTNIKKGAVAFFVSFVSLSSGALLSILLQGGFRFWFKYTSKIKGSFYILGAFLLVCYFTLDLVANSSPVEVFIRFFTFNSHSSYFRVLIWDYASQNVIDNPFFGIGLSEWVRPSWIPPSIDNFWLINAVRFGFPGFLFIALAFYFIVRRIYFQKFKNPFLENIKISYLCALLGFSISLCTVHVWNATYTYFMFFLGVGVFLFTMKNKNL